MNAAADEKPETDNDGLTAEQREHNEAVQRGANDFMDSMNGYDFLAAKKKFGESVADADFLTNLIQFAFISFRRDGLTDADAFEKAMKMPSKQVRQVMVNYAGQPELFEDEPETPQGKGESAIVTPPPS